MWVKYKDTRINLNKLSSIAINEINKIYFNCCEEYNYFDFENQEQRDKALELIDEFIKNGNISIIEKEVLKGFSYLLDLDKELKDENIK